MAKQMSWTAENDRRLLMAILKVNKVKIDFAGVAAELSDDETTCSVIAVRRRMGKLREIFDKPNASPGAGRKRGPLFTTNDKATAAGKRVKAENAELEEDSKPEQQGEEDPSET